MSFSEGTLLNPSTHVTPEMVKPVLESIKGMRNKSEIVPRKGGLNADDSNIAKKAFSLLSDLAKLATADKVRIVGASVFGNGVVITRLVALEKDRALEVLWQFKATFGRDAREGLIAEPDIDGPIDAIIESIRSFQVGPEEQRASSPFPPSGRN